MTANGRGVYFGGDENVLELDNDAQFCEYAKNAKLYTTKV